MSLLNQLNSTFDLVEGAVYWKGCRLPAGNPQYIRYDGIRFATSTVVAALDQQDSSVLDPYVDSTTKQTAKTKKLVQYLREWPDAESSEDVETIHKAIKVLEQGY